MIIRATLFNNGATDPDRWRPSQRTAWTGAAGVYARFREGALVGWRYGAWRITELRLRHTANQTDEERDAADWAKPYGLVLTHESGPLIIKPGEPSQTLHDGRRTVHLSAAKSRLVSHFQILPEPYQVCSCHGHIWPCQEIDQVAYAAALAEQMDKIEASHAPGVCAACREPISSRQKTVTFPEPSRLLPGAPGPTFHTGRAACWDEAERYERAGRLADNPDIVRRASCPGIRFIHEQHGMPTHMRLQCTAGPLCTGLHSPAKHAHPCWYVIPLASNDGAYARPPTDCGYRRGRQRCLGADQTLGAETLSPIAGDLIWRIEQDRSR